MAAEDTELRTCRSQMLHIPLAHPLAAQHCQAGCCLPSLIPTPIRTPLARGTARTITRCDTSRFVFDQALAAVAIALQFARVVQPPAGSARFVNQILIVHTQHLVELGVFTHRTHGFARHVPKRVLLGTGHRDHEYRRRLPGFVAAQTLGVVVACSTRSTLWRRITGSTCSTNFSFSRSARGEKNG